MNDYMNTAQIAETLGLNQEYVTDRVVKRPDFPAPAFRLSRKTRGWERAKVEAWIRKQKERNER